MEELAPQIRKVDAYSLKEQLQTAGWAQSSGIGVRWMAKNSS
jgi:hypothetical protein